jgi:hypothetical protein
MMIIPRVEPSSLHLHQCHRAQLHVSLPLIKLNPFLPQYLVEVEDELAAGGVSLYLVKVLLSSCLGLGYSVWPSSTH